MKSNTLEHLICAWNAYLDENFKNKNHKKDDLDDFRNAIHTCQRIIAMQECRKNKESDFYIIHEN